MARMIAPTGVREVSVRTESGSRLYRQQRSGFFEVEKSSDVGQMLHEGFIQATGVARAKGYPCGSCGFQSWFKTCSHCGTVND